MFNYNFLPTNTRDLLLKLKDQKWIEPFTLVGGSALAIQISHRQSEDLDFILDDEYLDLNYIKRSVNKCFPGSFRIMKIEDSYQIDFVIRQVKVTFFSAGAVQIPFQIKPSAQRSNCLWIAPIDIIAVLKMSAIAQRNTMRDYYDLYYIAKYAIPLEEIIQKCKTLLPGLAPITYTETLIYTEDIPEDNIQNHLAPVESVTKYQIADYFEKQLIKIRDKI
ncbi:MAG: nucleotidyl transferase AbiEii/AbiGii toxin family protein [Candidatus Marinimicrobia bacterium]|nr:nucleotidyl transferase AbiEii/AbiGii toxin family protein [bacterium]MCG2716301.1 nucleotidyl transferase AbiEii/AbiGii toxin family protein [Candidatus Neomarinimicrobiota bacterium]